MNDHKRQTGKDLGAILRVADRIYRRDPTRFRKLIVWIKTAQRKRYENAHILLALDILEAKEAKGEPVADWWPYLVIVLRKVRTKSLEAESERYKKGVPNHVKLLMAKIMEEAHAEIHGNRRGVPHHRQNQGRRREGPL